MANEPVTPRVMAFLQAQDGPRHAGAIARGAEVSANSARKVLRQLDAAGRLIIDRTSPGSPGYQLQRAVHPDTVGCVYCGRKGRRGFVVAYGDAIDVARTGWRCASVNACERRRSRIKPGQEARALAAEWVDAYRRTDQVWRADYTKAELAEVDAALDRLVAWLGAGPPPLFHRLRRQEAPSGQG